MDKTIVLARYKEDIEWTTGKDLPKYRLEVVEKSNEVPDSIPNVGREPHSFLWYICKNYERLEGTYVFAQANPFDHAPNFLDDIRQDCDGYTPIGNKNYVSQIDGAPHHRNLPVGKVADQLFGLDAPNTFPFVAGGQFMVTAERIKKRSLAFYHKCMWLCIKTNNAPWTFERLWHTILDSEVQEKNG